MRTHTPPPIRLIALMLLAFTLGGTTVYAANDAVYSNADGCANRGLDVTADLDGTQRYRGRSNQSTDGSYYLDGMQGDKYTWTGGFMWPDSFMWSDALTEPTAINVWVEQE